MSLSLKSLALTTTAALSLSSAIAPLMPLIFPAFPTQAQTQSQSQSQLQSQPQSKLQVQPTERMSSAYPGQGNIRFRGQIIRLVSVTEAYRTDGKRTLILALAGSHQFRTLRLSGIDETNQQLKVTHGGFNLGSDSDTQAGMEGQLKLTNDRGMLTGFQGRVLFDNQPIDINFTRYEQYTGQGTLQFRGKSTAITRVRYDHREANQPKRLILHLADRRQVMLEALLREQGNTKNLQVQSGSFGLTTDVTSNQADLSGSLTITEQPDGHWRSLLGTLRFDGQPITIRFIPSNR